jgi:uncharacterized metal-binding protein YceD (DUF177 family)
VLAVIGSAGEQDRVPEHYEPVLAEQGRMALQDLVEEELLLALPEVPRNPEIAAVRQSTGPGGEKAAEPARGAQDGPEDDSEKDPENGSGRRYRPFAGLADLIRTRKG